MKILVAFSSSRHSREALDYAVDGGARQDGELVACLVMDTRLTALITDEVSDMGFLGEKVSDEFRASVQREYERQGNLELERLGRLAAERGVPFRARIESGDFVSVCLRVAQSEGADEIVVTRAQRSRVGRMVFGSAVKELARRAQCRVTIFNYEASREGLESTSP